MQDPCGVPHRAADDEVPREAFHVSFGGSPQEQAGAFRRNRVSGGAPAVAAEILGVSS